MTRYSGLKILDFGVYRAEHMPIPVWKNKSIFYDFPSSESIHQSGQHSQQGAILISYGPNVMPLSDQDTFFLVITSSKRWIQCYDNI